MSSTEQRQREADEEFERELRVEEREFREKLLELLRRIDGKLDELLKTSVIVNPPWISGATPSTSQPCEHSWEEHRDVTTPWRRCIKCWKWEMLTINP